MKGESCGFRETISTPDSEPGDSGLRLLACVFTDQPADFLPGWAAPRCEYLTVRLNAILAAPRIRKSQVKTGPTGTFMIASAAGLLQLTPQLVDPFVPLQRLRSLLYT